MPVTLTPFDESMISPEYIGWLNDKNLMKFSRNSTREHSRKSCLDYLASFENTENLFFGIFETSTTAMLGTLTVTMQPECRSGDIGILVGRSDARGRGFGRQAWGRAIDYLFETAGVAEVTAGTDHRNRAMVRIMERNGMQFLRAAPGDLPDDPRSRVLMYKMTKQQWIARDYVRTN